MTGPGVAAFAWTDGVLQRRAVVQCALSRVCGACGQSLGRPVAFVGDVGEIGRNEFHLPPLHVDCVPGLLHALGGGLEAVTTAGFEFVRPGADDLDQELRFRPNSLL